MNVKSLKNTNSIKKYTDAEVIKSMLPLNEVRDNVELEMYITQPVFSMMRNPKAKVILTYEDSSLLIEDVKNKVRVADIPIESKVTKNACLERVGGRYDLWINLVNNVQYHVVVK